LSNTRMLKSSFAYNWLKHPSFQTHHLIPRAHMQAVEDMDCCPAGVPLRTIDTVSINAGGKVTITLSDNATAPVKTWTCTLQEMAEPLKLTRIIGTIKVDSYSFDESDIDYIAQLDIQYWKEATWHFSNVLFSPYVFKALLSKILFCKAVHFDSQCRMKPALMDSLRFFSYPTIGNCRTLIAYGDFKLKLGSCGLMNSTDVVNWLHSGHELNDFSQTSKFFQTSMHIFNKDGMLVLRGFRDELKERFLSATSASPYSVRVQVNAKDFVFGSSPILHNHVTGEILHLTAERKGSRRTIVSINRFVKKHPHASMEPSMDLAADNFNQ
jgi:hypothetical protein